MKKITLLFLLLPFLGLSQVQIGQDIDGEDSFDNSGFSVSFNSNGTIVAIGSPGGGGFFNAGSTQVFENINGSWTQIGNDIVGDISDDQLGYSVSLSSDGNILAIGAVWREYVKVYENIAGVWTQIGNTINGSYPGIFTNLSGYSVSLSSNGNIVAIGTIGSNINGPGSGHVRVYENIGGLWTQIGNGLAGIIAGENEQDQSGWSVSLSSDGSIVGIGAVYNDGNGNNSGHVRVYKNQEGVWTQIGQDIDGEAANTQSGYSVSLSSNGNIIAIGAIYNDNRGHVRIYENILGVWTQIGQDIDGEEFADKFGYSVSLSSDGSVLAIGAIGNNGTDFGSGHVRVYKNQEGVWTQIGQDIDGEAANDQSGCSVSLSSDGSILAIGAKVNDGNGDDSGHVRVYSIASELALLEVVEDILGNINEINITATELNAITGVSGAIDGVNYTTALQNGTFVDSNNPTAAEIQLIIDLVNNALSLADNNLSSFSLYPNPTKNQFTIQLNNTSILEKVTIYNTLGQLVLTSEDSIVNTSKLASGSYIVEISTNTGKASKKLIIE